MTARTRSLVAGMGLALVAAGVLAGCATPVGTGTESTPGGTVPSESTPPSAPGDDLDLDAAWLDDGRMIGIVTQGSSTCVPDAGEVSYADGVLDVELVDPPADTPCTADLAPRVSVVGLPEGVDPAEDLEIRVTGEGYRGDTDLDGVAGLDPAGETDYLPSAGWTDEDGQFVLLTWGSSSCPPQIQDVTGAGAEVTVTFATPPADQVCTMDMAPRGTVAFVDGLDDDSGVVAVLTGGEFADVRVPIVGNE